MSIDERVLTECGEAPKKDSLQYLWERLDPDPEKAGAIYLELHARLTKLFECRGHTDPAKSADDALDRVGKRLAKGLVIDNLKAFATGVAKNIGREELKRLVSYFLVSTDDEDAGIDLVDDKQLNQEEELIRASQQDLWLTCVRECFGNLKLEEQRFYAAYDLEEFSPEEQKSLLGYVVADTKPDGAERSRKSEADRQKASRLRVRLRKCGSDCVEAKLTKGRK